MSDPLLVTIVIATYNRCENLQITLRSLQFLRNVTFEVVVVPGPCTDDTESILRPYEEARAIRVLRIDERNLSRARNYGIAAARGDIVAFLDDDAVPEPDWLEKLTSLFSDPQVGAVGGFIRNHTGYEFQSKIVVCDEFGRGKTFEDIEAAKEFCLEEPNRYLSLTGANVAFRKDILTSVSGFDENFEYFLDETDVNIRLRDRCIAAIAPAAEVHHKYAASHLRTIRNVPKNMLPIARSVAYFVMKHALPAKGWVEITKYLKEYEASEIRYKTENFYFGDIDNELLGKLTSEIRHGIRVGVKRGVTPEEISWNDRIAQYPERVSDAALQDFMPFRVLRPAQERLRLCMFSQQEGAKAKGGIARWTQEAAAGLAARGHEVTVIGFGEHDVATVDYTKEGYWSHKLRSKRQPVPSEVSLLDLPSPQREVAYAERFEFDRAMPRRQFNVVSAPIWDVEGAGLLAQSSEDRDFPVVLSLHTTWKLALPSKPEWTAGVEYFENHVKKIIRAELIALKRADFILANSRSIVADIEDAYGLSIDPERIAYVPHGISDMAETLKRDRTSESVNKIIKILFVGRLEKRKGIDVLTSSIPALMEKFSNIQVDIVGSGGDNAETAGVQDLQFRYPGRVFHRGFVDEQKLERYYAEADLFVAPSEYESFGLILIEAMRAGVPCIATRVGGMQEIVQDGHNGCLIDVNDAAGFSAAVERLCIDRGARLQMGLFARQTYEQRYTVDVMCESLERAYLDAQKRFRRGGGAVTQGW